MLVNQNFLTARGSMSPTSSVEFPSAEFPTLGNMGLETPEFGADLLNGLDVGQQGNANGKSFADFLTDAIDGVSQQDRHAVRLGLDFALGKDIDAHQVMIEQAKAESQLHLMSAVTNKLASGYQTLMNMQI